MNIAKRIVLSIMRRPGKTVILTLVIVIVASLIAGALLIQQGVARSEELAKRSLGAAVSLGMDYEAYSEDIDEFSEDQEMEYLELSTIESLGSRPEVKSYDYSQEIGLTSKTLKSYDVYAGEAEEEEELMPEELGEGFSSEEESGEIELPGTEIVDTPEVSDAMSIDYAYFNLRGIHYESLMAIEEGALSLKEGTTFTKEMISQAQDVAMVSDKFATLNNLRVGDSMVFINEAYDYTQYEEGLMTEDASTPPAKTQEVTLKIIGIYSVTNEGVRDANAFSSGEDESDTAMMDQLFQSDIYNVIYTSVGVVQRETDFLTEAYASFGDDSMSSYPVDYVPIYLLNSPDDLKSFTEAAKTMLPKYYTVISAQTSYDQIAGPMNTIKQIMEISLIVVIIAGLVIISLVIILFLRERRYEIGIYYALGERRVTIISQILIEVLLVTIIGLLLSIAIGFLISGALSDMLMNTLVNTDSMSDPYAMYSNLYGEQALLIGDIQLSEVMSNYSLGINVEFVLMLFAIGIGVALLSCIIPVLYLLKLNPKRILM